MMAARVAIDDGGCAVDGRRAVGAAHVPQRERRCGGRIGRARGRGEDEGLEFAGDRARGARQAVDPRADGRQAREARSVS